MGLLDAITQSQNSALAAPGAYSDAQQANQQNVQQQGMIAQTANQNMGALNQQNDLQAKQRQMQLSMLSGALNEPDPDKQRQILQNIVPIANKINPSYQIDPNIDIPTVRALVQSQITPTEQAQLQNQRANAQLLAGIKSSEITKDPMTGGLVRVNKLTGEKTPVTPQDAAQYQTTGIDPSAPQPTGIFPQPNPQISGPPSPQQVQPPPQQPPFGFPLSSYANDLPAMRAAQKNTTAIEANKEQKDSLIRDIRSQLDILQPDLAQVNGGNLVDNAKIAAGALYPGGSDQYNAADAAKTNAQGLALNLSKLQQIGSSGRTTVAALSTLLNSKPDPTAHNQQNNLDNLAHIRGTVENYDAENNLLLAYKDANPMHLVDDNAYKLYDSLQKQFPITTVDDKGHTSFNPQNVQALNAAIPDALANPQKYINAKTEAGNALQPGQKQSPSASQANTIVKSKNGVPFIFLGGDPTDQKNYKPASGGASGGF